MESMSSRKDSARRRSGDVGGVVVVFVVGGMVFLGERGGLCFCVLVWVVFCTVGGSGRWVLEIDDWFFDFFFGASW